MDGSSNRQGVSAGPPPTADPQDPLPESNWTYRRILVFLGELLRAIGLGVILAMLFFVARAALAAMQTDTANAANILLATIESLYNLGWWLVMLTLVDRVLYLIAPSAEQATKMLATVHAWKSGVSTAVKAKTASPAGRAETSTIAGPAVAPPQAKSEDPTPARDPWEPQP